MMKFQRAIILFLGLLPSLSQADFLQKLEAIEATRNHSVTQSVPEKKQEKRYFTLSNGKRIDITDWQIVHFMSSTCSYCQQFNPILKQISENTHIPVFTYSFDGKGDSSFPDVFNANKDVLDNFFAELPRATPTDFIINVHTMMTLPLTQGATTYEAFIQRLDEVFMYVDQNLKGVQ